MINFKILGPCNCHCGSSIQTDMFRHLAHSGSSTLLACKKALLRELSLSWFRIYIYIFLYIYREREILYIYIYRICIFIFIDTDVHTQEIDVFLSGVVARIGEGNRQGCSPGPQRRNALFFGGKGAVVGLLDLGLFYPAVVVNSSDLQYTGRAV